MTKNKFPKSVSFNRKNKIDQAILEYVKKRNFSGYVKNLILADMQKNSVKITSKEPTSKINQLKLQLESAKNIDNNTDGNSNSKRD